MGSTEDSSNPVATGYKDWYCFVKYEDGIEEYVQVKSIKLLNNTPFKPSAANNQNFNPKILYSVKTAFKDCEGKANRYYAFIGAMGETLEECEANKNKKKRISFPPFPLMEKDPNNTSQDEAVEKEKLTAGTSQVIRQRLKKNEQNLHKRKAQDNLEKFLDSSPLHSVKRVSDEMARPSTSGIKQKKDNSAANTEPQRNQDKALLDRIKFLEKELAERDMQIKNQKAVTLDDVKATVSTILEEKLKTTVKEIMTETLSSVLSAQVEEVLSELDENAMEKELFINEWLRKHM